MTSSAPIAAIEREKKVLTAKPLPDQEYLLSILSYDEAQGTILWKVRTSLQVGSVNGWNTLFAGKEAFRRTDRYGYRQGKIDGKSYLAHRIIWKMVNGEDPDFIDHINNVRSDNRISNLRSCTHAENSRNCFKSPGASSQYRGVCWDKRDKAWVARISDGEGGKRSLGYFKYEELAALAYDAAAREMHGDFAILNFARSLTKGESDAGN
ncbi:MAG: HNH endonuclease [Shinella sp.]|uniref:HNH endonuclease n=1 Tax=Shinella sp. TaxID=1870904 RepID=UPI004036BA54